MGLPKWACGIGVLALLTACSAGDPTIDQPSDSPVPNSGFQVATNGFSFENYANEPDLQNLDPATMRHLFGDRTCARIDGDNCTLFPTAAAWMRRINDSMDGGHCFGMAGLSWAMYTRAVNAEDYGGPDASALHLKGNPALQGELASLFATQFTQPTQSSGITVGPAEAIDRMEQGWSQGKGYVLAIYRLQDGEQADGHAITPVSVQQGADGTETITVYDNNFPMEPQQIEVDTTADTWTYRTSADPQNSPEIYRGGANNQMQLYPVDTMLQTQACPFCDSADGNGGDEDGSSGPPDVGNAESYNMVFLNQGAGHHGVTVSVAGDDGEPIPGATSFAPFSSSRGDPEVQVVPDGIPFVVKIDGTTMTKPHHADVSIIGPGTYWSADNIDMVPGATDEIHYDPTTDTTSYRTEAAAAPDLSLGFDDPEASYDFLFGGLDLAKGGTVDVSLDRDKEIVTARTGGSGESVIDFRMARIDARSSEDGSSEPIPLAPDESLVIEYGKWKGNGTRVPVGIDKNADGQIDEPLTK
ncbi:MAG: hypothetical protein U0R64_07320 [Candidatus Nanopelagicales bacterium]